MHSMRIDNDKPIIVTVDVLLILGNLTGRMKPNGINKTILPPTFTTKSGEKGLPKLINGIKLISPLLIPMPKEELGNIVNRQINRSENRTIKSISIFFFIQTPTKFLIGLS